MEEDKEKMISSKRKQAESYNTTAKDLSTLAEGGVVRIKPSQMGQKERDKGVVTKQVNQRSYEVETSKGILRRNRVHLNKSGENSVTEKDSLATDKIKSPDLQREKGREDRCRSTSDHNETQSITESEKNLKEHDNIIADSEKNSDDCREPINVEVSEKEFPFGTEFSRDTVRLSSRTRKLPGHLEDFKLS